MDVMEMVGVIGVRMGLLGTERGVESKWFYFVSYLFSPIGVCMSERKDKTQKRKRYYPTEPFVDIYEGHKRKWGEILNDTQSPNRRSKWNKPKLYSYNDVFIRLRTSYTTKLLEVIQVDDDKRLEKQKELFELYVDSIENREDVEWVSGSEGGDYSRPYKKKLVMAIDYLDKDGNNPFDLLWYLGSKDRKRRERIFSTVLFILITLIVLGFILVNNRKYLFGIE